MVAELSRPITSVARELGFKGQTLLHWQASPVRHPPQLSPGWGVAARTRE
jgi:hypothetical protein